MSTAQDLRERIDVLKAGGRPPILASEDLADAYQYTGNKHEEDESILLLEPILEESEYSAEGTAAVPRLEEPFATSAEPADCSEPGPAATVSAASHAGVFSLFFKKFKMTLIAGGAALVAVAGALHFTGTPKEVSGGLSKSILPSDLAPSTKFQSSSSSRASALALLDPQGGVVKPAPVQDKPAPQPSAAVAISAALKEQQQQKAQTQKKPAVPTSATVTETAKKAEPIAPKPRKKLATDGKSLVKGDQVAEQPKAVKPVAVQPKTEVTEAGNEGILAVLKNARGAQ